VVSVDYQYSFNYRQFGSGIFPVLQVRIARRDDPERGIDTDVYLDSGAQRSLIDGRLLGALEIDLLNDKRQPYSSTAGHTITGYLHDVRLTIPNVGDFDLEIGFSDVQITRNLLGRDFFNLVQIGFREQQLEYYLDPAP
jgi:hypothetical protein